MKIFSQPVQLSCQAPTIDACRAEAVTLIETNEVPAAHNDCPLVLVSAQMADRFNAPELVTSACGSTSPSCPVQIFEHIQLHIFTLPCVQAAAIFRAPGGTYSLNHLAPASGCQTALRIPRLLRPPNRPLAAVFKRTFCAGMKGHATRSFSPCLTKRLTQGT